MGKPIDLYEQSDDAADNIFVSKSFDATSHFETCTGNVAPSCFNSYISRSFNVY